MAKIALTGRRAAAAAALAGLAALTAAGCGSGGSSSGSNSGQLSVLMSDAPPNLGGNVTAVNVTVTQVAVHPGTTVDDTGQDSSWKTVFTGRQNFNLLDLANRTNLNTLPKIVNSGLPAGHYNQMRLIIDPTNPTIVVDGTSHPLVVPSGAQTGLKTQSFDIQSQQDTVLLLDFDVSQSVSLDGSGTYKLQPKIRVAPVTLGSVSGTVVNASGAPMSAAVTLKDSSNTVVGSSITTASGATPPAATDGVFAIHAIAAGTYTLEVDATGMAPATKSVVITDGSTTDAGTVTLNAGP